MDRPRSWHSQGIDLSAEPVLRIGGATIDPVSREATSSAGTERLQPQNLKVLIALARREGRVVTRTDLIDLCWDGRIVGEDVINHAISVLRVFAARVGGFSIETVPKAGYRLVETGGGAPSRLEAVKPVWRRESVMVAMLVMVAAGAIYSFRTADAKPPRVAVLPFEASGVEPALAEGMSDELLSQLTRTNRVHVIGRTSSEQFKKGPQDLRSIGRELDVQYIVEGTVRSSGKQLQVTVALVKARDGSAIWAQTFRGRPDALQSIQAALGSAVAQSMEIGPLPVAKSNADGHAYELYLRAKSLMRDRNSDGLPKAVELLQEALRTDPKFAPGWAQLAAASHLALKKEIVIDLGGPEPLHMSKREAAERALKLDPNLAEAHAILGLLDRPTTQARVHLRRALELAPNDTQALYWWGATFGEAGDYKRAGEIMRQTAALDPLWKRPVQEAISSSLVRGERAAAIRYLHTIQASNPAAAVEVEAQMAFAEADFSRVVQLELTDRHRPWDAGKATAVRTLASLGFLRETLLIGPFGPFARAITLGHAPPLPEILEHIRNDADEGDDLPIYAAVTWGLANERRWNDLAAIYDARIGLMRDVKGLAASGRYYRQKFAALYAIALNRVGRNREAAELALAAADGAKRTVANGEVPPDVLVSIAGTEAILGRSDDALRHLEQAFDKNWRLDEFVMFRLGDRLEFATLRGDPRFEVLRRIQDAHILKERRETLALGVI